MKKRKKEEEEGNNAVFPVACGEKNPAHIVLSSRVPAGMSQVLCKANSDRSMYTYLSRRLKGVQ